MSNRIHWKHDGTLGYFYFPAGNTKAAFAAADYQKLDGDIYTTDHSEIGDNISNAPRALFNFPDTISISKIGLRGNTAATVSAEYSTDSTDGLDGTWASLFTGEELTAAIYKTVSITPTNVKWIRVRFTTYHAMNIHFFGEYQNPRYEFWDNAGSAELTAEYPLALSDAPNSGDSNQSISFKIKNLSGGTRSYSLSVAAVRYGGDTTVTSNVKLSVDGGTNKLSTVTITDLADNTLSGTITAYLDLTQANNLADGYHYFAVDVTETA